MIRCGIIDDDQVVARMIEVAINSEAYQYQAAHTLTEGLQLAWQSDPDIVFLDISLADGNGIEYLDTFPDLPSAPKRIVFSGSGDEKTVKTAIYRSAKASGQRGEERS